MGSGFIRNQGVLRGQKYPTDHPAAEGVRVDVDAISTGAAAVDIKAKISNMLEDSFHDLMETRDKI